MWNKNKVIMKKAIAMKCTQENWDSIKGNFDNKELYSFETFTYIVNNYINKFGNIGNVNPYSAKDYTREIHETFNAKIFLEACGIETKPTLEEVKEYFKNAEIVKEICYKEIEFKVDLDNIYLSDFGNYVQRNSNLYLWSEAGYAKILTYKEQKFEITKETILKYQMKDEFPEAFKANLEVGKWMKTPVGGLYCPKEKQKDGFMCYGFTPAGRYEEIFVPESITDKDVKATPQEVETALIGEWKKLGGKDRCKFINRQGKIQTQKGQVYFSSDTNSLNVRVPENEWNLDGCNSNPFIFKDGKFVKIIETITIQEAEKLLKEQGINKKIV